jgi:hypothetical protein
MKLYKYNLRTGTVIEVEGDRWPGKDSDGDTIYENTHFHTEAKAWEKLLAECQAGCRLAGDQVDLCRSKLADAQAAAGDMCAEYARAMKNRRQREAELANDTKAPT